jgi:hypothetical protein
MRKAEANRTDHGVDFQEALTIFADRPKMGLASLIAARHCSRQPGGLHLEVGAWRELCQKWRISTKFGASFTR